MLFEGGKPIRIIKVRKKIEGEKALATPVNLSKRMKDAVKRTKEKAEETQESRHASPTEYASENVQGVARETVRLPNPVSKAGRQTLREVKQRVSVNATTGAPKGAGTCPGYLNKGVTASKRTGDTAKSTANGFKQTTKGTIKTAKKSIKTVETSAKNAVKTAQRTAKTAGTAARSAGKSAKAAQKAARATTKAAARSARIATKVTRAMVRAAIAAIRGLVALIAAGGWVAVAIVLIICLIGLLSGSAFGIFFSGEDSGTGRTMSVVVSELTSEFYDQIEGIKRDNPHDILDVAPMSINWPEVLAVYAVKINTDPDNPAEVATLDDDKVNRLRGVLNDMAILSHHTTEETEERTVTDDDGDEITETVTIITLHIALTHKSADDMALEYGFSEEQKDLLDELLSPEYAELWAQLLGGYTPGNGEILIGNPSRIPTGLFSWPLAGNWPISSLFGNRPDPFTGAPEFHGGIDIPAPEGTPILAAADGVVVVANGTDIWGGGYGYYVKIQHEGGYATLYAHCSRISVRVGQEVVKGEVIGFMGSTGRSTGSHLHWEIHRDGVRVDPLGYFG